MHGHAGLVRHTIQGPGDATPIVLFEGTIEEWEAQNLTPAQMKEVMRQRRQSYGTCCGQPEPPAAG